MSNESHHDPEVYEPLDVYTGRPDESLPEHVDGAQDDFENDDE